MHAIVVKRRRGNSETQKKFDPKKAREKRINEIKEMNQYLRCEGTSEKYLESIKTKHKKDLISKSHWILGLSINNPPPLCVLVVERASGTTSTNFTSIIKLKYIVTWA